MGTTIFEQQQKHVEQEKESTQRKGKEPKQARRHRGIEAASRRGLTRRSSRRQLDQCLMCVFVSMIIGIVRV